MCIDKAKAKAKAKQDEEDRAHQIKQAQEAQEAQEKTRLSINLQLRTQAYLATQAQIAILQKQKQSKQFIPVMRNAKGEITLLWADKEYSRNLASGMFELF